MSRAVERIVALARNDDIPLVGMGPSEPMEHERSGYRPTDLLAGSRGMVSIALPVPRGIYGEGRHAMEIIWRAQNLLYRRLDTLSLRLAQILESEGERAVAVFGCCPMDINRRGEVAGYVNQMRMALHTGVGVMGRNGLLVHRLHGSRLMLGGLVTTAELPSLHVGESAGPGCPQDCRLCVDACPVRAIVPERRRVNSMRCLAHTARTPLLPRLRFGLLTRVNRPAAARLLNQTAFDDLTMHVCSRCIQVCPMGD